MLCLGIDVRKECVTATVLPCDVAAPARSKRLPDDAFPWLRHVASPVRLSPFSILAD
jgi:hypothetical protein